MLTIYDEAIQRAILSLVYRMLNEGQITSLVEAGFSMDTLESLRKIPAANLETLCRGGMGCSIYVDDKDLRLAIRRVTERQQNAERLEYYVANRAPVSLIIQLFKVSSSDINAIRDAVCPPGMDRGGRTSLPCDSVRDSIHQAWAVLCADETVDARDTWIILHKKYNAEYSIGTLYSVVNEFADRR